MARHPDWVEELYTHLANEEDARVCKAISDKACREVPGNFFLVLLSNTMTKIGDRLASPKTTLAWILQVLGAPAFFTGIIVPLRESGSLIPQLLIAGYIRRLPVRKWVWVGGSLVQALAIGGIGAAALNLKGASAGWSILGLLAIFSLARGFCSIASKDVLGKTVPKTRRGFLKGLMSSVSGIIAIAAGVSLIFQDFFQSNGDSIQLYAGYVFVAALLWMFAALVYSLVREFPGETEGGGNSLAEALRQVKLLGTDKDFTRFVTVRALAMGSGLSSPFVISLAHSHLEGNALWLGLFIVADGAAAMVAGPLLGRAADRSSRTLLRYSMLTVFCLLIVLVVWSLLGITTGSAMILFPVLFLFLGVTHNGVRLGRKTYLVDMAEGNLRTSYVAVSNTLIGILLLTMGVITGLLALASVEWALACLGLLALAGFLLGKSLPEVSEG